MNTQRTPARKNAPRASRSPLGTSPATDPPTVWPDEDSDVDPDYVPSESDPETETDTDPDTETED